MSRVGAASKILDGRNAAAQSALDLLLFFVFFPKALRRVLPENLLNTSTLTLHLNTYTLTLLCLQWHRSIQVKACK